MGGPLEGKSAIVTGAGGGVGAAIARRFAAAGARVMLADTDDAGLDDTVSGIDAAPDRLARFTRPIDDKLGVTNLIAATNDAFEGIDILVTGVRDCGTGGLFDLTPDAFAAALAGNVQAVFLQSQLVARRMVQQREANPEFQGALVNVSSIAARRVAAGMLVHSVACAALDQLTRSMAVCLAPERIRVNAVAVGAVMCGPLREALRDLDGLRAAIAAATPLGRVGEAAEAAEAALFLASPAASFVTGQIVAVDGGRLVFDPLTATPT